MRLSKLSSLLAGCALSHAAWAGPPYVSDDPEPTDFKEYEVYLFAAGEKTDAGRDGAFGLDFNYGATPDLQLTAAFPVQYDRPAGGSRASGLGNFELAAKYRFLHQAKIGWDVAVFPRVFLPSASNDAGDPHATFFLPLWLQKDWAGWSTFGGGGCAIHNGAGAKDFCQLGWAVTHDVAPGFNLGAEFAHKTPDAVGGRASTSAGLGARCDLSARWHVLAYGARGVQNVADTFRYSWYTSLLLTF